VHIEDGSTLKPGDWAQVKILSSHAHDLRGRLVPKTSKRRVAAQAS